MRSVRLVRGGFSLLEVLVALLLLGTAGSAWLLLLAQTRQSLHAAHVREERFEVASALLRNLAQHSDSTLLSLVGRRRMGAFDVRVSSVAPQLFELEIAEPMQSPLLRTLVYRSGGRADVQ